MPMWLGGGVQCFHSDPISCLNPAKHFDEQLSSTCYFKVLLNECIYCF